MDKQFVSLYVSKETAEYYEKLKGNVPDDDIIQEYIDKTKKSIDIDLDGLDYTLLQYKAMMAKWHKSMKEAYEENENKAYELFEQFDNVKPDFDQKIDRFVASATPLKNLLNDIEKSISKINTWDIEKLLELIQKISMMSVKEKDILKFLLKYGDK